MIEDKLVKLRSRFSDLFLAAFYDIFFLLLKCKQNEKLENCGKHLLKIPHINLFPTLNCLFAATLLEEKD